MTTALTHSSRPILSDFKLTIADAIEQCNTPENWVELDGWLGDLKRIVRELDDAKDAKGLELVRQHGPFQCDTKRWYEGTEKKIKPRMKPSQLINWLREKLMGDEDAIERCLSSSAIKHGQARKELEEVGQAQAFDEAFETEAVQNLETGKPKTGIKCIDTRFLSA